jgi:hypothetical protein
MRHSPPQKVNIWLVETLLSIFHLSIPYTMYCFWGYGGLRERPAAGCATQSPSKTKGMQVTSLDLQIMPIETHWAYSGQILATVSPLALPLPLC